MRGGTGAVGNTQYKRSGATPDMVRWANLMAEDNGEELTVLRRRLAGALREELTPRQREVLTLYYQGTMNMAQIGAALGVRPCTVSRTLRRGEERLRRCLRYGSPALLSAPALSRQRSRRRLPSIQDEPPADQAEGLFDPLTPG